MAAQDLSGEGEEGRLGTITPMSVPSNNSIPSITGGLASATSQTLPRGSGRYISSFLGFAPVENPQVLALVIINNPQGIYYGGTIAFRFFSNGILILPVPSDRLLTSSKTE